MYKIRYPISILFLVNFTYFIVQSQLLRLPTENMDLLSSIFYIDSILAFIGRQLTLFKRPFFLASEQRVLFASGSRLLITFGLFFYLAAPDSVGLQSDILFLTFYAVYAISFGYIGTLCYTLLSPLFPQNQEALSRATFILGIYSTLTTYLAALFNFTISPLIFN